MNLQGAGRKPLFSLQGQAMHSLAAIALDWCPIYKALMDERGPLEQIN